MGKATKSPLLCPKWVREAKGQHVVPERCAAQQGRGPPWHREGLGGPSPRGPEPPPSFRTLWTIPCLAAQTRGEKRWKEGRKERRHSCCPVYVAAGKAPATVGGPGRLLSPPHPRQGAQQAREGVVPEPWALTLSPLGLAPWPQECGGGEKEPGATGMRTAAAAGSRDVRSHLPGQLLVGRGVKSRGSPGPRGAAYL